MGAPNNDEGVDDNGNKDQQPEDTGQQGDPDRDTSVTKGQDKPSRDTTSVTSDTTSMSIV
jgi:hypothetical protein